MLSPTRRAWGPPGFIRLKTLLTLLIVGGALYVGVKVVPAYWGYLAMQDPVKEAAMAASRSGKEDDVRRELIARAKEAGIALDEERVEIGQHGNMVVVRIAWEVPMEIPMYRHPLRFRIEKGVPAP
jgi:hypothetical protein